MAHALQQAYRGNPQLNANRAGVRVADESVPIAQAGYRPTVGIDADIGVSRFEGRLVGQTQKLPTRPGGAGLTVNQVLFNGFQTDNLTRRAESVVFGERESLRNTEMNVLYGAVQAYMAVLADTATVELRRNNIEVLEEQLSETRKRYTIGEVTQTDIDQAEARLEGARADLGSSEAQLRASVAQYRQVIGSEPRQLAPGRPLDQFVPDRLAKAIDTGLADHPAILAALHQVDAAEMQVKVLEGTLYPQVSLQGSVQQRYDQSFPGDNGVTAAIVGRLSVPLYQGGGEYAQIRQAKEQVGQTRIQAEQTRDQIRAGVVTAWGLLEGAKVRLRASQAQVKANESALRGVRAEANVGQRTTLDVLNAQQELLTARIALVLAQQDRVVYSYGVVLALGRLTVRFALTEIAAYDPKQHYDQVKGLWYGVRTPDGR